MLKDFKDLLPKLDELVIETELISDTFAAIEEGLINGANEVSPQAIVLPNILLVKNARELRELTNMFYETSKKESKGVNLNGKN